MSDSNITKRALAAALKELMRDEPFSKISVGDICARCELNRKSFYYHFRDKYDLVNWIFSSEFVADIHRRGCTTTGELLLAACRYLNDNRAFYRRALEIRGQNSLHEFFREGLEPLVTEYASERISDNVARDFYVTFFCDAFMSAIERWIFDMHPLSPERFVALLANCVLGLSGLVSEEQEESRGMEALDTPTQGER